MPATRTLILCFSFLFAGFGAQAQNDCVDAIVVCGDTGFQGLTASGIGTQEISGSTCFSEENNSIWLKLPIRTSGKLAFTLTPDSADIDEDFDFFIFGPNVSCGSLGQSIRCSTTNPSMAGLADNLTGMNDLETDTSEGPGELGNSFVQSLDVLAGEVYYLVIDRPIGFSDFSLQWTGTSSFETQPQIVTQPIALTDCVPPGQLGVFNLNRNYNAVVGGQAYVLLSYHLDTNDALTGSNPIVSPTTFAATSNPQTIYVRLTNTSTGCFSLAQFDLETLFVPTILTDTYTICDDAGDGSGTNGQTVFNLNDVSAHIMGNQSLSGLTINYFSTVALANANSGTPLPVNFYNTSLNLQNVYVRVSNASGCVLVNEIHLQVLPEPAIHAVTLTQCDTDANPDGLTTFDLNLAIPNLTANNAGLSVAFFENGNSNPLNPSYTNLSNPQIITAQITNLSTGCKSSSPVTLIGNTSPPPTLFLPAECDVLNIENGLATFNLNDAITLAAGESVQFFESANEALLVQYPIANPQAYVNQVAYADLVYVRIESSGQCASISPLALSVTKLPKVVRQQNGGYICTDDPSYIITLDAAILEGTPSDYTYQWYQDQVALAANSYTLPVNQAGTYTVDVTRNGCTITRSITVLASSNPDIDNIVISDLITDINTVDIQIANSSLGDYLYALDNANGPYQQSALFDDVAPGIHDLYVKDLLACGIFGPIQINVLGIPKYFTPNNDGFADRWNIIGIDPVKNNDGILYIFDRYGKLLSKIYPTGSGWDGTYENTALPADDYWYTLSIGGRFVKGHFALKR